MADIPEASFIFDAGRAAADAVSDQVVGGQGGRSGRLNSVGSGLLQYPSDLGSPDSTNGIINWIQFNIFFKENGSLDQTVTKLEGAFGSLADTIQSDESNSEVQQIEQIQQGILGGAGADQSNQQSVIADSRLGEAKTQTGDTIALYLPGGIQYEDGFNYEDVGFAGIKNISNLSAARGAIALGALQKLGGVVDKAAGIVGQESLNTGQALSAQLGVVVNPRKEQMFQGVNFRTFSFNFTFIPRSLEEAETVKNIIRTFRFHAYPELSQNGAFFNFPSEFEIKFMTADLSTPSEMQKENKSLPKISRCFIDKISTNYTPDEIYYAFNNGMSPKITLELSFKEAEVMTRNHISEGY